jgi:hypothetical protein
MKLKAGQPIDPNKWEWPEYWQLNDGGYMNCCDDWGDCRQGRDCPVRKEMLNDARQKARGDFVGTLLVLIVIACVFAIVINFYKAWQ